MILIVLAALDGRLLLRFTVPGWGDGKVLPISRIISARDGYRCDSAVKLRRRTSRSFSGAVDGLAVLLVGGALFTLWYAFEDSVDDLVVNSPCNVWLSLAILGLHPCSSAVNKP